jgi:hypothetical protein
MAMAQIACDVPFTKTSVVSRCNDLQSEDFAPDDYQPKDQPGWSFSTVDEQDGYFSDSVYDEDEMCTNDLDDINSVRSTTPSNRSSVLSDQERKLAEENEILARENLLLRQRCEEIKRAALQSLQSAGPEPTLPSDTSPDVLLNSMMVPSQVMPQVAQGGAVQALPSQMIACAPGNWWQASACPMQMIPVLMMPGSCDSAWPQQVGPVQGRCTNYISSEAMQAGVREGSAKSLAGVDDERTTVMLRNLPNNYSRGMLLDLINSEGFKGEYDFLYLPIDFTTKACFGYAFVNLVTHEAATRFRAAFDGFSDWIIPSRKRCIVSWSDPHQGLIANIDRYRNSPVMHSGVPDEHKPILFRNGVRVSFPEHSKKLRAPRVRHYKKDNA